MIALASVIIFFISIEYIMSGNTCDNNPSKLGRGFPGTSNGAGSPLDRFRLRNGFGQYTFLQNANLLKPCTKLCDGPQTVLTPFRQAFNAGDYLGTINSGPNPSLPQINQVNSLMAVLTAPGQDGLQIGSAGFTGNQRWVYDSSDYIRFKNLQAKNRNYNDSTSGGDESNASQVALMRVRR